MQKFSYVCYKISLIIDDFFRDTSRKIRHI